jgi:D-sedoheptulose 7-phosphate isomerase
MSDEDVVEALRARLERLHEDMLGVLAEQAGALRAGAALLCDVLATGGTVFTCGNGGSAAQAIHVEAELLARYRGERRPLPSLYLGAAASTGTATANDYDYAEVFARPLAALGREGDLLLGLTTSGTSANVLRALDVARERGLRTIVLTGAGAPAVEADVVLRTGGDSADAVQDGHHLIVHALMDAVEARFVR